MKVNAVLHLATLALVFSSAFALSTGAKVEGTASFPQTNPFGHVVNGEKSQISVLVENKSDVEIDVKSVFGSFSELGNDKLIRNTTTLKHTASVLPMGKISIPYVFHSEFKPQESRLQIWVEYLVGGQSYHLQVYDSIVSIVEPAKSIFDLQLILTYIMLLGILGGGAYLAVVSYFPGFTKKPKARAPSTPTSGSTAIVTGYSEEWIPEHHLKARKIKIDGPLSSGEESGPEKKARGKRR